MANIEKIRQKEAEVERERENLRQQRCGRVEPKHWRRLSACDCSRLYEAVVMTDGDRMELEARQSALKAEEDRVRASQTEAETLRMELRTWEQKLKA